MAPRQSRRIETKILREGASQRVVGEVCIEKHREEREKGWRQREKQNERQKQRMRGEGNHLTAPMRLCCTS